MHHIDLWSLLVMEQRKDTDRWRVMPTTMMRNDYPDLWEVACAGVGDRAIAGVGGPPLWEVNRVRY